MASDLQVVFWTVTQKVAVDREVLAKALSAKNVNAKQFHELWRDLSLGCNRNITTHNPCLKGKTKKLGEGVNQLLPFF